MPFKNYIFLFALLLICFGDVGAVSLFQIKDSAMEAKADSLVRLLPEKLVTIVDKTLDDQFAEIENLASILFKMDKKKIFLITLPMENYIEDIYFPANQPAVIYPRIIFKTIYEELKKGKTKKEIARTLVNLQKQNAFEKQFLLSKKRKNNLK